MSHHPYSDFPSSSSSAQPQSGPSSGLILSRTSDGGNRGPSLDAEGWGQELDFDMPDSDDEDNDLRKRQNDEEQEEQDDEMRNLHQAEVDGGKDIDLEERKKRYWRNVGVTGIFVLLWYGFSTCLSLYNKWIFGTDYFAFPWPMFTTFIQMIVQFLLAACVRYAAPDQFKPPVNPGLKDYGLRVTPTGVTTALDIGLSNLSLKTISLSLYTMCKSSTLIFVLFFAFFFRLELFSWRLIFVILLISAGVFLMAFNETSVHIVGMAMVFIASVLGGLRWALTHTLMIKEELGMPNPFATIFWISPIMAVTLAIISMATDGWGNVFRSEFFEGGRALMTVLYILLPGILAFLMVSSEYYIIQRAGIVPLSVAGIFKEITTISIASWIFGDELTIVNVSGLVVTMIGIIMFSHHKYQKSLQEDIPRDSHGRPIPIPQPVQLPSDSSSSPPTTLSKIKAFFAPTPRQTYEDVPYQAITVFDEESAAENGEAYQMMQQPKRKESHLNE